MTLGRPADIGQATPANETFRTGLHTGRHTQLTAMHLQPGEEIGDEAHDELDRLIRVESGLGLQIQVV